MAKNFLEEIVLGTHENFQRTQDETFQTLREFNLLHPSLTLDFCSNVLDKHDGPEVISLKPLDLNLEIVDTSDNPYKQIKRLANRVSRKENIPFSVLMLALQQQGFFTDEDKEAYFDSHPIHSNIRALQRGVKPVYNTIKEEASSITSALSQLGRESIDVIGYGVNSGIDSLSKLSNNIKPIFEKVEVKVDSLETPKISARAEDKIDDNLMDEILTSRDCIANAMRYIKICLNMGKIPERDQIEKLAGEHADRISIETSHRTLGEIIKDAMPNISMPSPRKAMAYSIPIVLAGAIGTTYAINGVDKTHEMAQSFYEETIDTAKDMSKDASMNFASAIGYITQGSLMSNNAEEVNTQVEQTVSSSITDPNVYSPVGATRPWHFDKQSAVWYNFSSEDPTVRVNVVPSDRIITKFLNRVNDESFSCDNNALITDMQNIIGISGTQEQQRKYISIITERCPERFQ